MLIKYRVGFFFFCNVTAPKEVQVTQTERERESANTFRETYDDTVTGVKQSSDNMKESLLLADFTPS